MVCLEKTLKRERGKLSQRVIFDSLLIIYFSSPKYKCRTKHNVMIMEEGMLIDPFIIIGGGLVFLCKRGGH